MPPIRRDAIPYSNPLIGASRHAVHFYESDDELASSVATFFLTGLLGGCGCVAIATHDHGLRIASKLRECGVDVEHATRSHQLAIFDADVMLGEICASGEPDQAAFDRIASQALQAASLHFSHILVFGEMVGVLMARDEPASAILFEQWCNECLSGATDVQMFCAYPRSSAMTAQVYETLCCAHTAVI